MHMPPAKKQRREAPQIQVSPQEIWASPQVPDFIFDSESVPASNATPGSEHEPRGHKRGRAERDLFVDTDLEMEHATYPAACSTPPQLVANTTPHPPQRMDETLAIEAEKKRAKHSARLIFRRRKGNFFTEQEIEAFTKQLTSPLFAKEWEASYRKLISNHTGSFADVPQKVNKNSALRQKGYRSGRDGKNRGVKEKTAAQLETLKKTKGEDWVLGYIDGWNSIKLAKKDADYRRGKKAGRGAGLVHTKFDREKLLEKHKEYWLKGYLEGYKETSSKTTSKEAHYNRGKRAGALAANYEWAFSEKNLVDKYGRDFFDGFRASYAAKLPLSSESREYNRGFKSGYIASRLGCGISEKRLAKRDAKYGEGYKEGYKLGEQNFAGQQSVNLAKYNGVRAALAGFKRPNEAHFKAQKKDADYQKHYLESYDEAIKRFGVVDHKTLTYYRVEDCVVVSFYSSQLEQDSEEKKLACKKAEFLHKNLKKLYEKTILKEEADELQMRVRGALLVIDNYQVLEEELGFISLEQLADLPAEDMAYYRQIIKEPIAALMEDNVEAANNDSAIFLEIEESSVASLNLEDGIIDIFETDEFFENDDQPEALETTNFAPEESDEENISNEDDLFAAANVSSMGFFSQKQQPKDVGFSSNLGHVSNQY
ncbi:hypothetical protein [Legionella septentrionalis]|uniref:hypothetical protein n=1 Tax=Legionella septentrionalis TaxID=2498109 RepID=UPI000F8F3E35|nr:hypothetical protein [Legionella septentrionalis]RUQ99754.1 hypothetical protein ELY11_04020 [Legionella septentrionalis]